jgi:hypothetical protein
MPYSKAPTTDTYSQEDIVLSRELVSRQNDPLNTKDETLVNLFVEINKDRRTNDNRTYHFKRAGSSVYKASAGTIRGSFMWTDYNLFCYCVGADVILYNVSTGATTTCSGVFVSTTGTVGMTLFMYSTGVTKLVVTDGSKLSTITYTGTVAASVSPDLPTPHLPQPVFLDGYLFLIKSGTADLYNSNLDDPLLYTAGDYTSTEIEGDNALAISKINNYIVVFGSSTIEYFYDAGEASGSPLKRNDTPVKHNGYIGGLAEAGNSLYYIGYNDQQHPEVYLLQDFLINPIGTEYVKRYFATSGTAPSAYYGFLVSNLGHDFYFVNGGSRSLVYDLKEKLWFIWKWKQTDSFQIVHALNLITPTGVFSCFQLSGDTNVYRFNDAVYQDNGTNFTVVFVTEPADFGTLNRKTMARAAFVGDRPESTSYVTMSISDDDFQTWYGSYTINLDQDYPSVHRLGSFRQRAFKVTYTDNYPMRIQKLQVDINKGRN